MIAKFLLLLFLLPLSGCKPSFNYFTKDNSSEVRDLKDVLGDRESLETLSQEIASVHKKNGGSTFHLLIGDMVGKPFFAVGTHPDRTSAIRNQANAEHIYEFILSNKDLFLDEKNSVGTWYDKENDRSILDVVSTPSKLEEALKLGVESKQEFIFDLYKKMVIPTGYKRPAPSQ